MPIFDQLPRMAFTTKDQGLTLVRTRPTSDLVLIVGPAVDGPTEQIIPLDTIPVVESLYGPTQFTTDYARPSGVAQEDPFNGNHLLKALKEVMSGGATNIALLRVGGTKASGSLVVAGNAASGTLLGTAIYGGRVYNTATVAFVSGATSGQATISQPDSKGGDFVVSWSGSSSGLTVREIVDRINNDSRNKTVRLDYNTISASAAARLLNGTVSLTGGLDGTFRDDTSYRANLYTALTDATSGALQFLEDVQDKADIVYLAGIYLDDKVVTGGAATTTSIANAFSAYLGRRTYDNPQIGVLGVRPLADASDRTKIAAHFTALTTTSAGARGSTSDEWNNAGYFMNNGFLYQDAAMNLNLDAGGYLQIVAADVVIGDPNIGLYTESAAGIYAGTLAFLKPHVAASSKEVRGFYKIPYLFSRSQLNTLTGGMGRDLTRNYEGASAYVTIRDFDGIVFTRDVTASFRNSDFSDLQPLRLANAVHKGVRQIARPYISGPNDISVRLALETQIKGFLDGLVDAHAILGGEHVGYEVDIRGGDVDPTSNRLGILEINIVLVPALQIKTIKVNVSLGLTL
jgi:hypothetical protein